MAGADGNVVDHSVEVDRLALSFGHQDGQGGGDAIAIAVGDEESAHAREGDGGKEILQINAQQYSLADVRFCAGANVAAFAEAVSDVTDGEFFDEEIDEPALDGFELPFRGHNEPFSAGAFGDGEGDVVRLALFFAVDGKVIQGLEGDLESGG